ncbi:MAG: ATP-binding protein [Bacteroidota bacterium]
MESPEILKNIIRRERKARKAAEQVIEQKSLEIFLANEELRSLNESLEEKILSRTQEIEASYKALQMAKIQAELATKAKSEFLSNMSHEIRTPLNAIMGFTDLIMQQNVDDTTAEFANTIKYAAGNLMKIINEILDFSKIEAGKVTFEQINFDFKKLIDGLQKIFTNRAGEKSLNFFIEVDKEVPDNLIGDEVKLNQVFINLIGNALKFTEKGFIKVKVSIENEPGQTMMLKVAIQDTGIGIPKSKQMDIFSDFSQANNSTTRIYGGTGLGLSITKKFIELQGGKIWLESIEGEGTTFHFELPVKMGRSEKQEKHKEVKFDENMFRGINILVVEDIAVNRKLMAQIFKRKNISVEFAVDGKDAIQALVGKEYDLVFMDLHMPIMDGKQATQIIRNPVSPVKNHDIPIIALTADAFEDTKQEVLDVGMDGFLTKPIEVDQLYMTLYDLFIQDKEE